MTKGTKIICNNVMVQIVSRSVVCELCKQPFKSAMQFPCTQTVPGSRMLIEVHEADTSGTATVLSVDLSRSRSVVVVIPLIFDHPMIGKRQEGRPTDSTHIAVQTPRGL